MASRNAKGRMIFWKISYSKQLVRCSLLSKLLFTWLIPNTDDLGRMEGDPEIVKGMVFPYDLKIHTKQIKESLEELAREKLIILYKVEDNFYIQFPNFSLYQKLRKDRDFKSDYPDPEDKTAIDMTSHDKSCHDRQKVREVKGSEVKEKGSEGEVKESNLKSLKLVYGEKVHLTLEQYEKLKETNGEQATNQMISILDNWYLTKGKPPNKSDYHTMVTNGWVTKRFNEDQEKENKKPGAKAVAKTAPSKFDSFYQ